VREREHFGLLSGVTTSCRFHEIRRRRVAQPTAEGIECYLLSLCVLQIPPRRLAAHPSRALIAGAQWWDNPTMIVSLDAKRRLTVPAGLAPASPGDYFDARFDAEEDALVFRRLPRKENWLAVLKACPVSPDDVPRRRRAAARRREL